MRECPVRFHWARQVATFLAAIKAQDRFAGRCSNQMWLAGILGHEICDPLLFLRGHLLR